MPMQGEMERWHDAEVNAVSAQLMRMLVVYSGKGDPDRAAAFIEVLVDHARCSNCVIWAIDDALANRRSLPTPAILLEHYTKGYELVHHHHIRLKPGQVDVGSIEAWWRQKAKRVIEEYLPDPVNSALALAIVGQMWSSGYVTRDERHVREEMDEHGTMYINAMTAFINGGSPPVEPHLKAERLIDKCVKQEAHGEESLSLDEVELKSPSRWERRVASAS